MAGKKSEVSGKKASGNARKAEAAAEKAAAEQAKLDAAEADEWSKGSKSNAKKEAEAAKKAELARKKAERDALIAQEEASLPSRPAPKKAKAAVKKTAAPAPARGLDLSQLDDDSPAAALNASGIDNALDALSLATAADGATKVDRHPERRFKAAYAAFEERRLREMDGDGSGQGLRQNQKKEKIKKEFERSPENPFNQVSASYDASKEELAKIKEAEKAKIEARLASK
ncbi:DUF1014-domain-containing protein [Coniochaeta ligniaria NRRL 30616]|uniref:DUF1014-domain-containing protein n=1 Tax=Coniochaeta ligniaria NRRL 30616 TaxID=1408157 RepID=A0A1J7JWF4_9PEZI|nr:DUF1014-domain-containing protein [Coniochaeta ligniaria NRRL 30616]